MHPTRQRAGAGAEGAGARRTLVGTVRPECLDRMLEWTVATQPRFLRWGTLISTYGRQLVLTRADLLEFLAHRQRTP